MRVEILCEDRLQEQLLEGLCRERGQRVTRRFVAPDGEGAASAWIRSQFAQRLRSHRAVAREEVGLLVAIDGDNLGWKGRLGELDEALAKARLPPRTGEERVAILVPTWSVETWIVFLLAGEVISEHEKSKRDRRLGSLIDRGYGRLRSDAARRVIIAWYAGRSSPELPALAAARAEASRLGLT